MATVSPDYTNTTMATNAAYRSSVVPASTEPQLSDLQRRVPRKRFSKSSARRKASTVSRSSTMPGFNSQTAEQVAHELHIRHVERNTNRVLTRSNSAKKHGMALYENSPSVPESLVQFSQEIHQQSRITKEEEKTLGQKTQAAVRLQTIFDTLQSELQREPTDAEWCAAAGKINMECLTQTLEEGVEAKNKLVTANLRMVQSVVNTYLRNGLTAQYNAGDLMQEGVIALIRAAEKFEPNRGWKFSTYAMYWVRASVKRSQVSQSRVMVVPQRLYENRKRLRRLEVEHFEATGSKPSIEQLAAMSDLSVLQVKRCIDAMDQKMYSLDQELSNSMKPMKGDNSPDTLVDILGPSTMDTDCDSIEHQFLQEDLIDMLNRHLSVEEVELLKLRYGLQDRTKGLSITEMSRIMGMKPAKLRRIIQKSLNVLKKSHLDECLALAKDL